MVQARVGSTRLPEKMLTHLGTHRVIDWVIQRLSQCTSFDALVIGTTEHPRDEVIADIASDYGWECFRGPERDVLSRFTGCANQFNAKSIVRVCADNPFVSHEVIDALSAEPLDDDTIVFNHRPLLDCDYVDGLGGERIPRFALERLDTLVSDIELREHVTLGAYRGLPGIRLRGLQAPQGLAVAGLTLDVDTSEDLQQLNRFVDFMSIGIDSPATTIVEKFIEFARTTREP